MKKKLIILTVLLMSFPGFGQTKFRLFGYYSCSPAAKEIRYFGLKKGSDFFKTTDTSGVLLLKDTGVYVLYYALDEIDTTQLGKAYKIKFKGEYTDTLRLLGISPCIEPTTNPRFSGYCCCGEKCEGRQVDYYQNGGKRIEGYFKEGMPVGKLIFYYPNGNIHEVQFYNSKGRLRKKKLF